MPSIAAAAGSGTIDTLSSKPVSARQYIGIVAIRAHPVDLVAR
jgi:hypothetical protein